MHDPSYQRFLDSWNSSINEHFHSFSGVPSAYDYYVGNNRDTMVSESSFNKLVEELKKAHER